MYVHFGVYTCIVCIKYDILKSFVIFATNLKNTFLSLSVKALDNGRNNDRKKSIKISFGAYAHKVQKPRP